ncbi:MAG: cobalt transporter CbiM [Candidatus Omnitrophica bacterium]|nr:cobalt transporter CbiM [Candidatus Omnitrophota bacterium]
MHIPDGYLGPATCGFFYAVMLPIWALASRIVKKTLKAKQVPMLAIGAAFSFIVMLFDIPIPGGTTAHAIGAVLIAILLGPWPACIAITVTLVIQAFLFGDGGILALGANSFNMAFADVFAGYYIYRLVSYRSKPQSIRRVIAAGIGAYMGATLAAILTAVEIGLQKGKYSPYGLKEALPAMAGASILVFGWVDALLTAAVVKYLQSRKDTLEIQPS